jgi:hypothetical protein
MGLVVTSALALPWHCLHVVALLPSLVKRGETNSVTFPTTTVPCCAVKYMLVLNCRHCKMVLVMCIQPCIQQT